jgi:hypothetical protein
MKIFFTTLCLSIMLVNVHAATFIVDNINYFIGLNNTVGVTFNTPKYSGNITIPSSVTNEGITYTVTDIGTSAFKDCIGLTAINLPATLKNIGLNAFAGCTALTSVTLPESVKNLESGAFAYCSNLASINIPRVNNIGNDAFTDCNKLTSLVLPSSVKYIGQKAFYNCTSLSVNIPDSVVTIGASAYSGTLLNTVTLPATLKTLSSLAFDGTPWSAAQPAGMIYIGDWAYKYNGSIASVTSVEIKEGTKYLAQYIFTYAFNLASVTLPGTIIGIPYSAFMACINLTTINLPESITYIDDIAFNGCAKLTNITFPSAIERIGDGALDNTGWYNAQANGNVYAGNWYYKYKGTLPANAEITIADGTVGIADMALLQATNLKSVHIPSTVRYIGSYAFQNCSNLTSIYALPVTPPDLSSKVYVFLNVLLFPARCTLYVPTGSKNLYQAADQWKDFVNIVEISAPTNVKQEEAGCISIYPNPVTDGFTVSWSNGPATLSICDINGKKLLEKQISGNTYLPAYNLSKGLYIVSITTANGVTLTNKLVKH